MRTGAGWADLHRGGGNGEMKGGAFVQFAFEPDLAAVHLHQIARDVQAESGSREIAHRSVFRAEKFLKDALLLLQGDPQAAVLNEKMDDLRRPDGIPAVGGALGGDP